MRTCVKYLHVSGINLTHEANFGNANLVAASFFYNLTAIFNEIALSTFVPPIRGFACDVKTDLVHSQRFGDLVPLARFAVLWQRVFKLAAVK